MNLDTVLALISLVLINLTGMVGIYVRIESRLAKIETTQDYMLSGMIKVGAVDRREQK